LKRREFISLLGGASAAHAWPIAVQAQQSPVRPLIGVLLPLSETAARPLVAAFRSALRDVGYIEGRNVSLVYHYGDGVPERMAPLAREVIE
jgi:putative ABC transport system substrate-binding protein